MVTSKVPQLKLTELSFEMLLEKLSKLASKLLNGNASSSQVELV